MTEQPWWKTAVIYQIYPRSFQDTNNDGIGDLQGIIQRLDYLNDGTENSLGIDAIWLSPIYPSPMKDFGYDISNHTAVDAIYGTEQDFDELLQEAHKRNIKILLDLVINHTSDQHPWFQESRQDKTNPKQDWYLWHPGKKNKAPNNWFSTFELKSAWWYDKQRKEYYMGTFTRYQPEVNWRNPELKNAMFDVIKYWLDKGVDGFRLDVVNWYVKDAEFRSNPWHIQLSPPDLQRHLYDRNQPETHEICKQIRKIIDQYPDKTTVGEIYVENLQNHKAIAEYYGDNDQLHLVFNFGLMRAKWNAGKFHKQIQAWENTVPEQCQPTWTLSNHDQPRHYTRYKNSEERAKVAIALLLTLRGTPFLYYGEEIGMENNKIPRKKIQDPLGKTTWPFPLGRDPERTPMQWTPEQNAGFTTTTPWLPIHKNYIKKNVQTQQQDRDSLLNHYKQLIWLRKKTPTLHKGTYKTLQTKAKHYLAYQRIYQDTVTTIFLNFTKKQQTIQEWQQIFQNQTILFTTHPDKELNNILQPYQILILHSDNPTTSTTE